MMKGWLFFIWLYFLTAPCNALESIQKNVDLDVKEDLKGYLLTQFNDIKVSEIYSRNSNKKEYFKRSLGGSLIKEIVVIKAHDIYFKELSAKAETHLGIAYFRYQTTEKAKQALSYIEPEGFFENTKILTKYVAINDGIVNVVVYTESAADKTVLSYLDSVSNKISNAKEKM